MTDGAWFGPLGGLRRIEGVTELATARRRKWVEHEGINGEVYRLKYGRAWRTWACSIDLLEPPELARLLNLADKQDEPYWLVPEDALIANVMTPEGSRFQDWTTYSNANLYAGGWVPCESGEGDYSVNPDYTGAEWRYESRPIPVPPGVTDKVTVSIHLRAASGDNPAGFRVRWVNGYGQGLPLGPTSSEVTVSATAGTLPRAVLTTTVEPGAAALVIQFRRASAVANPAVTWTDEVQPWAEGKAAERVWMEDPEDAVLLAVTGEHYHTTAFRFVEVAG